MRMQLLGRLNMRIAIELEATRNLNIDLCYLETMYASDTRLLYDYERAAELLSMTPGALRDLKHKGRGPRAVKIGRRTFFAYIDLVDFVQGLRDL